MNLKKSVAQNGKAKAESASEAIEPMRAAIPFDNFDWEALANDAETLRYYGADQYDAAKKVFDGFRLEFIHRLRCELKDRIKTQWKEETFERLKKEMAAK